MKTPHLRVNRPRPDISVVGWMEYIDLPDLGLKRVKAKFDTGARTSALHSSQIETFARDGLPWVRFHVDIAVAEPDLWIESPIHDTRHVKNTSGIPEDRIVIRTPVKIAGRIWPISVSLTDRSNMRLPMIVGRSALKKQNIVVHTRKTNLTSAKGRTKPHKAERVFT